MWNVEHVDFVHWNVFVRLCVFSAPCFCAITTRFELSKPYELTGSLTSDGDSSPHIHTHVLATSSYIETPYLYLLIWRFYQV